MILLCMSVYIYIYIYIDIILIPHGVKQNKNRSYNFFRNQLFTEWIVWKKHTNVILPCFDFKEFKECTFDLWYKHTPLFNFNSWSSNIKSSNW